MTPEARLKLLADYARIIERNIGNVLTVELANGLHLALANLIPQEQEPEPPAESEAKE